MVRTRHYARCDPAVSAGHKRDTKIVVLFLKRHFDDDNPPKEADHETDDGRGSHDMLRQSHHAHDEPDDKSEDGAQHECSQYASPQDEPDNPKQPSSCDFDFLQLHFPPHPPVA